MLFLYIVLCRCQSHCAIRVYLLFGSSFCSGDVTGASRSSQYLCGVQDVVGLYHKFISGRVFSVNRNDFPYVKDQFIFFSVLSINRGLAYLFGVASSCARRSIRKFAEADSREASEMRSPVSEHSSLIIENESSDDEDTQFAAAAATNGHEEEDAGSDTDSSSSCATPRRGPSSSSYAQQWPQSYRSRRFLSPLRPVCRYP